MKLIIAGSRSLNPSIKEIADLELATEFFKRIESKGFKLIFNKEAYGYVEDGEPGFMSIELLNYRSEIFCSYDFYPDGSFYRISGYTDGGWSDEVDGKKYD